MSGMRTLELVAELNKEVRHRFIKISTSIKTCDWPSKQNISLK